MASTAPLPLPSIQYMRDRKWIQQNIDRLIKDHPNQWVAVHGGRVLAAGPDADEVLAGVRSQTSDADVVVQFIDDGTLIFRVGSVS